MQKHYNNPIVLERADPWVYKHQDGWYYFMGSVPGYQTLELRRAKSLNELGEAEAVTIWHAHKTGNMSQLIWAPEIHFIQGNGTSTLLLAIMLKFVISTITIGCSY